MEEGKARPNAHAISDPRSTERGQGHSANAS